MACNAPMPARQAAPGLKPILGLPPIGTETMLLPCGKCTGCRKARAKEWALRCHLELGEHEDAAFTTLTYNDEALPPTLEKRHLQLFLKRLRRSMGAARPLRFFACGEYGEKTGRPHYHAILFGSHHQRDRGLIEKAWGRGIVHSVQVTPASINYVAGYTQKKSGDERRGKKEWRKAPDFFETGEVYQYQQPFIQMSRRPGIGGHARKYTASWKECAIYNGAKMAVPRFYHAAWKKQATEEEINTLAETKKQKAKLKQITLQQLQANEKIQQALQAIQAAKRTKI